MRRRRATSSGGISSPTIVNLNTAIEPNTASMLRTIAGWLVGPAASIISISTQTALHTANRADVLTPSGRRAVANPPSSNAPA